MVDIDGVRQAVGPDLARLVPRRDPEGLAAAMDEVLASPDLRARMSRAALDRARRGRTSDDVCREYAALYSRLSPPPNMRRG